MKLLKEVFPGSIVKVERNSLLEDWIVVEQSEAITTLLRKNALSPRRIGTSGTAYEGSEIDNWLSDETTGFLSEFSAAMQMKIVSKTIGTYVFDEPETIIVRRAFLPSLNNMQLNSDGTDNSWVTALVATYNAIAPNTYLSCKNDVGSTIFYWLRTPYSQSEFYYVNASGSIIHTIPSATTICTRPAIAVSGDCLVGNDNVLLPDDDKPYREVELIGIADHMSYRPTVARVEVNAVNLYDVEVQVTNNAKDETPVWVDAVGGNTVEFTNTEKTSELWELGVRLYGKSDGIGYFTEPIIIIKEDTGNG